MRIRPGTEGDLEAILRVERGAGTAPHWGLGEYQAIVRGEGMLRCLYVADADGVVGFAVGRVAAGEGEVESVAVEEGARMRGTGRELMGAVVEWCKGKGAESVDLEVRAGSAGALRLYAAAGFKEVGRRKGYYSGPVEDAILMKLDLGKQESASRSV